MHDKYDISMTCMYARIVDYTENTHHSMRNCDPDM